MPLELYARPSFERSLKRLSSEQVQTVALVLEALTAYYFSYSNLTEAKKIAPGFFYKKLRHSYYEAGVESNLRVVLTREKEKCIAIVAGNHDQIRQFLANA